jgi:P4 family phage/plasmid primase-like protien
MARLLASVGGQPVRDELLASVDVPALFAHLGVDLTDTGDGKWVALCPFHVDGDRPNLSVGPGPVYHCFSCGESGSLLDAVVYHQRHPEWDTTDPPSKAEVGAAFKFLREFVAERPPMPARAPIVEAPEPPEIPWTVAFEWHHNLLADDGAHMLRYLTDERGLTLDLVKVRSLGYDPVSERITIPVADEYGALRNVRKYQPGAKLNKCISYAKGYGRNRRLNPHSGKEEYVLLCAGEMDYLVARSCGFPGADTFTAGEATVPKFEQIEDWIGKDVYVFYDHDDAGRKSSKKVAAALHANGCRAYGYDDKADLSDLVNVYHKGDGQAAILSLIRSAEQYAPAEPTPPPAPKKAPAPERKPVASPAPDGSEHSDLGNARLLVHLTGGDLKYLPRSKSWLAWDGTRWVKDEGDVAAMGYARQVCAYLLLAAAAVGDDGTRRVATKWAFDSQSSGRMEAMVKLARTEPSIVLTPEDLDAHPHLLNLQNGTLDTETGELRPHAKGDYLTKILPFPYDPDAGCPLWERFMAQVLPDADVREYVEYALGHCLSGSVSEHVFFVLYGTGRNGKGVFLQTVQTVLGDYACNAASDTFMVQPAGRIRADIARLAGVRFVAAEETNSGKAMDVGVVKWLTGGTPITAERKYEAPFEYLPQFKPWLATNHKPVIKEIADPIWERLKLIPFTVYIPRDQRDTRLPEKLAAEAPGIFARLVRACAVWRDKGLSALEPEAVRSATVAYRDEQDTISQFLRETCDVEPGGSVLRSAMTEAFGEWFAPERMVRTKFNERMRELGYKEGADEGGRGVWRGLALRKRRGLKAVA